jgi:hypothetical protein
MLKHRTQQGAVMPRSVTRSVRYLFVASAAALLLLAGAQSFDGAEEPRMGLSSCGWDGNPCLIEGVVVKAEPIVETEIAQPVQHSSESSESEKLAQS